MTEFAPEDFFGVEGREEIEQLSDAFLAAGADLEMIEEELDDDPIEPMDI